MTKVQAVNTVTLQAKLVNYPDVPAATKTFTIELIDPCLTTSLNAEPIVDFTIYSFYNGGGNQTFSPFTDSQALIANTDSGAVGVPALCGPRVYTASTTPSSNIAFTITPPPDGNVYSSKWTLKYNSVNLADVLDEGLSYTVTLKA